MTPKLHRSVAALAAAAVLVAGCSGSDDADLADTTAPTSTETVATDPPATDPPATDPPVTNPPATDPPVIVPPATDPPTSNPPATRSPATDPPITDPTTPEGEVERAVAFFEQQWRTCVSAVPNCDVTIVGARRQPDEANLAVGEAVRFNNNDYRTSNFERLDYRVDGVAVATDGAAAQATVCVTDPIVVTEADGTPVDDRFLTSFQTWDLILVDDQWNLSGRSVDGEIAVGEEANVCT